jgi:rare lipoprotein A
MKTTRCVDPCWTSRLGRRVLGIALGIAAGGLIGCASDPSPDRVAVRPVGAPVDPAPSDQPVVPVDPASLIDEAEPDPIGVLSRRLENPPPEAAAAGREERIDEGLASYYGRKFHGRRTASGERFDMSDFTAAHRTLPFGSKVRVRNLRNGKEVVVRINDRGPFKKGRVIDVSRAAAEALGMVGRGLAKVELLRE